MVGAESVKTGVQKQEVGAFGKHIFAIRKAFVSEISFMEEILGKKLGTFVVPISFIQYQNTSG